MRVEISPIFHVQQIGMTEVECILVFVFEGHVRWLEDPPQVPEGPGKPL